MKKYSDGWHKLCGYDVYIEDDMITRATLGSGLSLIPASVYRRSRYGGLDKDMPISPAAFISGVNRGTVTVR